MNLFPYVLAAITTLFVPVTANAQDSFTAVHQVISGCRLVAVLKRQPSQDFYAGFCLGTVNGLVVAQGLNRRLGQHASICGGNTRLNEYVSAFVAYIDANPEMLRQEFTSSVGIALGDVFPCVTSKSAQ